MLNALGHGPTFFHPKHPEFADAARALDLLVRSSTGSRSREAATQRAIETSNEMASASTRRQSGLRTAVAEAAVAHACRCVLSGIYGNFRQ